MCSNHSKFQVQNQLYDNYSVSINQLHTECQIPPHPPVLPVYLINWVSLWIGEQNDNEQLQLQWVIFAPCSSKAYCKGLILISNQTLSKCHIPLGCAIPIMPAVIFGNMLICLMAYGCLMVSHVIITNAKGLILWFQDPAWISDLLVSPCVCFVVQPC